MSMEAGKILRHYLVNTLKHFFADGAYERKSLMDKAAYLGFVVEVVKRTPGQTGFQPMAKRWVVERTFGWLVRWRRLVRDYERRLDVSESMIQIAMASILLKRFIIINEFPNTL